MTSCMITDWKHGLSIIVVLLLEAWLGKTNKVRYASTLELVAIGSFDLIKRIFTKGELK